MRVACFNHDTARAYEIVRDTGDLAAAYHLARQLESVGEVQEAISFYATSGCYNHAIRLAKQYSLDADLMAFAIKARPRPSRLDWRAPSGMELRPLLSPPLRRGRAS